MTVAAVVKGLGIIARIGETPRALRARSKTVRDVMRKATWVASSRKNTYDAFGDPDRMTFGFCSMTPQNVAGAFRVLAPRS